MELIRSDSFTAKTVYVDAEQFAAMCSPDYYVRLTLLWARRHRAKLYHRYNVTKKKRIRKKYLKMIYNETALVY